MPQVTLDLSRAESLLDEGYRIIKEINGYTGDVDYDRGRSRKNDPTQAGVARDLMRLSELLSAAAGEVSVKYWDFKGYPDPRT
jgi:hypothetical protein